MPFAINEATRFISPTKTPEYLAAGGRWSRRPSPMWSRHYGDVEGVLIAGDAEAFVAACEQALALSMRRRGMAAGRRRASGADMSWDQTFRRCPRSSTRRSRRSGRNRAGQAGDPAAERRDTLRLSDRRRRVCRLGAGRAAGQRPASGSFSAIAVRTSPATPLTSATKPASSSTNMVRTSSTPTARRSSLISRVSPRWRPYEHRVLAAVAGKLLPIPINRTTLNGLYELDLKDEAAPPNSWQAAPSRWQTFEPRATSSSRRSAPTSTARSSRAIRASNGASIRRELDKSVTARIPTRTSTDDRYFLDTYQAMPADGFTAAVREHARSREHPRRALASTIATSTAKDWRAARSSPDRSTPISIIASGRCPTGASTSGTRRWIRSSSSRSPSSIIRSEDVPYTRITEYKHLTGQSHAEDEHLLRISPAPTAIPTIRSHDPKTRRSTSNTRRWRAAQDDVIFVGRLGTYNITIWIRWSGRPWPHSAGWTEGGERSSPALDCGSRMRDRPLEIVLATDSAVPSGVGEHMLTLAACTVVHTCRCACLPDEGDGARFLDRGQAGGLRDHRTRRELRWVARNSPARQSFMSMPASAGKAMNWCGRAGMPGIPVVRTEHLPYLLTDPDQKSRHRMAASLVRRAGCRVGSGRRELPSARDLSDIITIRNGIEHLAARGARAETRATLGDRRRGSARHHRGALHRAKGLRHSCCTRPWKCRGRCRCRFPLGRRRPRERGNGGSWRASLDLRNVSFLGERADVPDLLPPQTCSCCRRFRGLAPGRAGGDGAGPTGRCDPHRRHRRGVGQDHPFLVPAGEPLVARDRHRHGPR